MVSVSGSTATIDPVNDRPAGTGVEFPETAFRTASNVYYAGTTDKTTWNFTTDVQVAQLPLISLSQLTFKPVANENAPAIRPLDVSNGQLYSTLTGAG